MQESVHILCINAIVCVTKETFGVNKIVSRMIVACVPVVLVK